VPIAANIENARQSMGYMARMVINTRNSNSQLNSLGKRDMNVLLRLRILGKDLAADLVSPEIVFSTWI
jgi:hypothetical protein